MRIMVVVIVLFAWQMGMASAAQAQSLNFGQDHSPSGPFNSNRFHWSLYLQTRYTGIEEADDVYALRRFKLRLGGQLNEQVKYYAQGIFKDGNRSHTDGRAYLQEAWIEFTRWKHAHIKIGQFKPPFGMERFTSDAKIYTINRSQAIDHLIPNGGLGRSFTRDRGIQLDGRVERGRLYYAFGVFDGHGANHQFHGIGPLLATRVTYEAMHNHPVAGRPLKLHLGGAFSTRQARDVNFKGCCPDRRGLELRHFRGRDTRFGLELAGDWGGTSLRAEYLQAHLDFRDPTEADFTASGYYIQGAQFLTPEWQAVVKFEQFDPNRSVLNNKDLRWTTVGLNYYIRGDRAKVMVNYVFRRERANPFDNDALMVQFQLFLK